MLAVASLVNHNLCARSFNTQPDRQVDIYRGESTLIEKTHITSISAGKLGGGNSIPLTHEPLKLHKQHQLVEEFQSPSFWDDEEHRRVTLAKLVKGVYELEHRRLVPSARDSPLRLWWESMNFEMVGLQEQGQELKQPHLQFSKDANENSINVAVYRWKPTLAAKPPPHRIVIAVRGTLFRFDDGWHNMHILLQRLHETPRYEEVRNVVKNAVAAYGHEDICIAGHSLGATLGLLVARSLAVEERVKIAAHLFNPVYTWLPDPNEFIKDEGLWSTMRAVRCATAIGLSQLLVSAETRATIEKDFQLLEDWTPHLYINTGDPICRGYWKYFHNHERLARQGVIGAQLSAMAAPYSTRGLVLQDSKPTHLVPSAVLHVYHAASGDDWSHLSDPQYVNHNLGNWWLDDLQVETRPVRLSSW